MPPGPQKPPNWSPEAPRHASRTSKNTQIPGQLYKLTGKGSTFILQKFCPAKKNHGPVHPSFLATSPPKCCNSALAKIGGRRCAPLGVSIRRPPEFTEGCVACGTGGQCSKQIFEPPLPPPAPCIPPGRSNGCAILIFSGSKMHAQKRSANNSKNMLKYRLNGAK